MTRLLSSALLLATLGAFALSLPRQDPPGDPDARPQPRSVAYTLRSGKGVHGVVVAAEGERVQLRLTVGEGTATRWYDLSEFDDLSQVRLKRERVADGDWRAQLEVAEFASHLGLVDVARTELRRARSQLALAGEDMTDTERERVFELTVSLLERLCAQGRVSSARSALAQLLTGPGALSEEERSRLIAAVEAAAALARANRAGAGAVEAAAGEGPLAADRDAVEALIAQGVDLRRRGLLGARAYAAAQRDLLSSVETFEQARASAAAMRTKYASDPAALELVELLDGEALDQWQDTLISAAQLELARGRFQRALEGLDRILALEPDHAQARAVRARVEVMRDDWTWPW